MSVILLKCVPLTTRLKRAFSSGTITLEKSKAESLEARGEVKIIHEEQGEVMSNKVAEITTTPVIKQPTIDYIHKTEFEHKGKPKVAWIQDFSKMGGAELSNCQVVKIGALLGFDIVGVCPSSFKQNILKQADMLIVNNFFEFSEDQTKRIMNILFEERKPFVKYEHDMRELPRLRITRCLYERSKLNFFISPLHEKEYKKELCADVKSCILPLAINVDEFKQNTKVKRIPKTILIPAQRKGLSNLMKYVKDRQTTHFSIIGNGTNLNSFKNVKVLAKGTSKKMIDYYSSHESVLHMPTKKWAGDRVIFEGALCGCNVITNQNAGHVTWGYDLKDTKKLRNILDKAPYTFWKEVEKVL